MPEVWSSVPCRCRALLGIIASAPLVASGPTTVVYQFKNSTRGPDRGRVVHSASMPKRPKGEWRPTDPVACAVHVAKIATGETKETFEPPQRSDPDSDKTRASRGGKARSVALTPARRREIAAAAARARWESS